MTGAVDWEGVTALFGGAGIVGAAVWGWIVKQRSVLSETKVRVAEDDRDRAVADSQNSIYTLLTGRLAAVEAELLDMRKYARKLEEYVDLLARTIREAGHSPPKREF